MISAPSRHDLKQILRAIESKSNLLGVRNSKDNEILAIPHRVITH